MNETSLWAAGQLLLKWGRFCFLQDTWPCCKTFLAFITGGTPLSLERTGQGCFYTPWSAQGSSYNKEVFGSKCKQCQGWESAIWKLAPTKEMWLPRISRLSWDLLIPNPVPLCILYSHPPLVSLLWVLLPTVCLRVAGFLVSVQWVLCFMYCR